MSTGRPRVESAACVAARALAVGGAAAVLTLLTAVQVLRHQAGLARRLIGKPLGEQAHVADRVYERKHGGTVDLLLLGDSIAAGLGAEKPKRTLGAQLAKRLAKHTQRGVRLHTGAQVGAESSMLRAQLSGLPPGYRADVAVVVVGGNDITHRVRTADSVAHLAATIDVLRAQGTAVVVGTCPDLSALEALPQPLRTFAGVASRRLAAAQREVALAGGARVVSLAAVVGPFFADRPDEMFAEDRFHPSGSGYRRTAKALLPAVVAALDDPASSAGGETLSPELPHGEPDRHVDPLRRRVHDDKRGAPATRASHR